MASVSYILGMSHVFYTLYGRVMKVVILCDIAKKEKSV